MKLSSEPFSKIVRKKKLIESRLYDEKRQKIKIGDEIEFSESDNLKNKVKTRVRGILRYESFKDLFADYDPVLFGEKSRELLLNEINQFYSDEDQMKNGVVGFRIEVLD